MGLNGVEASGTTLAYLLRRRSVRETHSHPTCHNSEDSMKYSSIVAGSLRQVRPWPLFAVLSLCFSGVSSAAVFAPSKCPDASQERYEGKLSMGSSTIIPIDLQPCEMFTVSVTTDTNERYGAAVALEYHMQEGGSIETDSWAPYGYGQFHLSPSILLIPNPWPGVVGGVDRPAYAEFKALIWDVEKYTIVVSKFPRPGYNLGGRGFDDALGVSSLPTHLFGSIGGTESGQYYKVLLDSNQTVSVSGFARGSSYYGAGLWIEVYNEDGTPIRGADYPLVFVAAYGREDYFTRFTNPYPKPSYFYFRLRSLWTTIDFRLDVEPIEPLTCPIGAIIESCTRIQVFDAQGFLPNRRLNTEYIESMYRVHLGGTDEPYSTTADGVSRLVIQFDLPTRDSRQFIVFSIDSGSVAADGGFASDLLASPQPSLRARFEPAESGIKRAVVVYVPPENLSWSSNDERSKTRDVTFSVDYPGVQVASIRLHRPPVVFVHGFTSGPWKWNEAMRIFRNLDGPYRGSDIWTVDYSNANTSGIDKVFGILPATISAALWQRRNGNGPSGRIATTKVDVVAHSMGGLITKWFISDFAGIDSADRSDQFKRQLEFPGLSRNCYSGACTIKTNRHPDQVYLRSQQAGRDQSNFGSGDIRRVITVGTPFGGSDIANRVLSLPGGPFLSIVRDWGESSWVGDLGAFDDLAVGSKALELLDRARRVNAPRFIRFGLRGTRTSEGWTACDS